MRESLDYRLDAVVGLRADVTRSVRALIAAETALPESMRGDPATAVAVALRHDPDAMSEMAHALGTMANLTRESSAFRETLARCDATTGAVAVAHVNQHTALVRA